MANTSPELTVFVSSPGDLAAERQRAHQVIGRLAERYAGVARLTSVFWENQHYRAHDTFQAQIKEAMRCDAVVCLIWSRLGTRLPDGFPRRADGTAYESGTVYEYETARAASSLTGGTQPDLFMFRKLKPFEEDPKWSEAELAEERRQRDLVREFWAKWFDNPVEGFKTASEKFETPDQFEEKSAAALEKWLREELQERGLDPAGLGWDIATQGSPFVGLKPFEASHHAVFAGRRRAIARAVALLRAAAERGPPDIPYLLVRGASGCGKSSLARAGVVPTLAVETPTETWRRADFRPGADPLGALAAAVFGALAPELTASHIRSAAELAEELARQPDLAARRIARALDGVAEARRRREQRAHRIAGRLLLLTDQLEEAHSAAPEARKTFAAALKELLATGQVWAVATLRADRQPALAEDAALRPLADPQPGGGADVLLTVPDDAEVAEIIERPARLAGLRFEPRGDTDLAVELRRDMRARADALPLLQMALQRLYEAHEVREGRPVLTFSSYEAIGRLDGAIATKAEEVFEKLPPAVQEQLPTLIVALVAGVTEADEVTTRPLLRSEFATTPEREELLGALAAPGVWLLVADQQGSVRVAHEALLRRWGRARAILADHLIRLRTRQEVEGWRRHHGEPLPPGSLLARARDLLGNPGEVQLDADLRGFIQHSLDTAERREREDRERLQRERDAALLNELRARKMRRWAQIGAVFATVLAVVAGVAGVALYFARVDAEVQRSEAVAQRERAEQQAREAKAARTVAEAQTQEATRQRAEAENQADRANLSSQLAQAAERQAIANESRALVALSEAAYLQGRHGDALKLALASWPRRADDPRPMLARALRAMGLATQGRAETAPPLRHEGPVLSAVFAPDGARVLTASGDGTARLWDAVTGAPLGPPLRHEGEVNVAVFAPDGARVLTASRDGTARLWDAVTGAPLGPPLRHEGEVNVAVFAPDGARVLTASGRTARLWDAASGALLGEPLRHEQPVSSAAFAPDGARMLTRSGSNARLWDAASGALLGEPLRHEQPVSSAAFAPDGARVLTASEGGTARLWDAATGVPLGPPLRHEGRVLSAAFSPRDGARVLTASGDRTARLWDAVTGAPLGPPLRHEGEVNVAVFAPDGARVLTASRDGTARLWDAASGAPLGPPLRHGQAVSSAAFAPDGARVVTRSGSDARLWDAASGALLGEPLRHEGRVLSAAFAPDGARVLTASGDGTARLWDAATGVPLGEPLRHGQAVSSAAFSPRDGARVLTASGYARLWDAATGVPLGEPLRHGQAVLSAAFAPDGARVLTASGSDARLWDAATGVPIGEPLRRHGQEVLSAAFAPDGARVLTASGDGTARLWDAATGVPLGPPLRHEGRVLSAAFAPDGARVLTRSYDNTVRLWDAASGAPLGPPLRHEGQVLSAAFAPDGARVVTRSGSDARLWDAASGAPLGPPLRHEGQVLSAAFAPDGARVLTASGDGTARLWDAASGALLGEPLRHEGQVLSAAFAPDGARVLTASGDGTARLWDAATGVPLGPPLRHEAVSSATFSPDGTRVVTASGNGTARLWDVRWPPGPITAVACALLSEKDVGRLAVRYGIIIQDPICGSNMPAPDLARLDRR